MNPFHLHSSEQITEGDLIALHLHELSPRREQAVLRAIESSASLAAESDLIVASLSAVKDVSMQIDDTVLDRNWKALSRSLVQYPPPPLRAPRWRLAVFGGALVASAAALAFLATTHPFFHSPKHDLAGLATSPPRPASPSQESAGRYGSSKLPPQRLRALSLRSGLFHSETPHPSSALHPIPTPSVPLASPPSADISQPVLSDVPLLATAEPILGGMPLPEPSSDPGQSAVSMARNGRTKSIDRSGRPHDLDLMLGIGANLILPHSVEPAGIGRVTETSSPAVIALASLHQQFRRTLGYRVTMSYSRPDFIYTDDGAVIVNSRIYEAAGTYVIQGPHLRRFKTSAEAGVGLLAFLPTVASQFSGHAYRAAGVVGANLDYAINKHWGARASYRAQVYKSPNFSSATNFIPDIDGVTISNEPSLGIVYNFGKK